MRMTIKIVSAYGRPFDGPSAAFDESGGTIGRRADCTLVVPDKRRHVSRIHALIVRAPEGFLLHDQGSYLPVRVNGMRVGYGQHVPVFEGDTIQIGPFGMRVEEMETLWDVGVRAPEDAPASRVLEETPVRREDVAQSFVITDLGVEGGTPVDFVLDDGRSSHAAVASLSGGQGSDAGGEEVEGGAGHTDTSTFDLLARRLGAGSAAYQPFMPAVWEEEAGALRPVPSLQAPSDPPPAAQIEGPEEDDDPAPAERIRHLLAAVEADFERVRPGAEGPLAAEQIAASGAGDADPGALEIDEPAYPPGEPPLLMPEPRQAVPVPDGDGMAEAQDLDRILRRRQMREDAPAPLQAVPTSSRPAPAITSPGAASDRPEIVLVLERVEADPGGSGASEFFVPVRRRNRRSATRSSAGR
jgi:hypothetical protein